MEFAPIIDIYRQSEDTTAPAPATAGPTTPGLHFPSSFSMAKKKGVVKLLQEIQGSSDSEESVLKVEDVGCIIL